MLTASRVLCHSPDWLYDCFYVVLMNARGFLWNIKLLQNFSKPLYCLSGFRRSDVLHRHWTEDDRLLQFTSGPNRCLSTRNENIWLGVLPTLLHSPSLCSYLCLYLFISVTWKRLVLVNNSYWVTQYYFNSNRVIFLRIDYTKMQRTSCDRNIGFHH